MPHRIDIELTSERDDGSWTWRAAGARQPRGVVDAAILPDGPSVGDQLKVEVESDVDGISIVSIVTPPQRSERTDVLELLPSDTDFQPVVEHRAPRQGRGSDDRGGRRDRRPREGGERRSRGPRPGGDRRRPEGRSEGERGAGEGGDRRRPQREGRPPRRHFDPPPELPKRPKPKRLRAGSTHTNKVLDDLPEASRPIAELALQGIPAVRQRLRDDNKRARDEGRPQMPEDSVIAMAEELLPRLRAAEWSDRAEAAKAQLEHLDLRDLRSVVAASQDPVVVRDESTRALADELKAALATKQEQEMALWLEDIVAALDVGRVIRALRLSSEPPKAGVLFPAEIATRLAEAASQALGPDDASDRWSAVLEAAAFAPVRAQVQPGAPPAQVSDELRATVTRLGPLLPQVAQLFGIEVPAGAPTPRPLRPTRPPKPPARQRSAK